MLAAAAKHPDVRELVLDEMSRVREELITRVSSAKPEQDALLSYLLHAEAHRVRAHDPAGFAAVLLAATEQVCGASCT